MLKEVYIDWGEYERIFHEWVMCIFKRITDVDTTKFDKAIGLKYKSDMDSSDINDLENWNGYIFEVVDEEKFMLAVLKFSVIFKTFS
jgi:hypothetical protein